MVWFKLDAGVLSEEDVDCDGVGCEVVSEEDVDCRVGVDVSCCGNGVRHE